MSRLRLRFFTQMNVRTKLRLILFSSILSSLTIITATTYENHLLTSAQEVQRSLSIVNILLAQIREQSSNAQVIAKKYLLSPDPKEIEYFKQAINNLNRTIEEFRNNLTYTNATEKREQQIKQQLDSLTRLVGNLELQFLELSTLDIQHANRENAIRDFNLLADQVPRVTGKISALGRAVEKQTTAQIASETFLVSATAISLIVVLCVGITIMILFVGRSILHSTQSLQQSAQDLATGAAVLGDRIDYDGEDEMSSVVFWFNQFLDRLEATVTEIATMSTHLAEISVKAQSSKDELASEIMSQLDEISTLTEKVKGMESSLTKFAKDSRSTADSAQGAATDATVGTEAMSKLVAQMQSLGGSMEHASAIATKLDNKSQSINNIISMINNIAEQTNLLALNAAIEAARAGEAGRGFAVVADEIRSLSVRTTDSVSEIQSTIATLQVDTQDVVVAMNSGAEKTLSNIQAVQDAATRFTQIREQVSNISDLNEKMATSSAQESQLANDISTYMSRVSDDSKRLAETSVRNMSDTGDISQVSNMLLTLSRRFSEQDSEEKDEGSELF